MAGTPVINTFASVSDGINTVVADESREQLHIVGTGAATVSVSSPEGVPTLTVNVPEVVIPTTSVQVPPNSYFVGTGGYISLEAAVADLGSTPATISFTTDQTLTGNFSSPATLEILPLNGAKINHGSYTITYRGNTTRWPLQQVFNGTGLVSLSKAAVYPEWFGAYSDGTNATVTLAAINAAINAAGLNGGDIRFSPGIYLIDGTINHNTAGRYTRILGSGMLVTIIKATTAHTMLNLGTSSGFHGRKMVSGITFNGGNISPLLLDATYIRYSVIRDNEFVSMAAGGYAANIGSWTNRFETNTINGAGTDNSTPVSNGFYVTNTTINNLSILGNSFSRCLIGVYVFPQANDIVFKDNTFDICTNAAIYFHFGTRNATVTHNYFEACGTVGVAVETSAGVFTQFIGAIVSSTTYNNTGIYSENLNIKDNQFANCGASILAISHVAGLHVEGNHTLAGYYYDHLVNLLWTGAIYTKSQKILIDHMPNDPSFGIVQANNSGTKVGIGAKYASGVPLTLVPSGESIGAGQYRYDSGTFNFSVYDQGQSVLLSYSYGTGTVVTDEARTVPKAQFQKLVGLNTTDNKSNTSALVIRNRQKGYGGTMPIKDGGALLGNPLNWPSVGTPTYAQDGYYEGRYPVYKIQVSSISHRKSITLNLAAEHSQYRGRYLRISYLSKGTSTSLNGINVKVLIDGVALDATGWKTQLGSWSMGARHATFYVPTLANTLEIQLNLSVGSNPAWFTMWSIVSAEVEPADITYHVEPLILPAVPTYGSGTVGDTILLNPAASGYIGAVCTVAGSPGTWKRYGAIEP